VVGANASGKSNFVQVFRFLRDILQHGLENAVSLQSGLGKISNIKTKSNITEITTEYSPRHTAVEMSSRKGEPFDIVHIKHRLAVGYNRKTQSPRFESEVVELKLFSRASKEVKTIRIDREREKVAVKSDLEERLLRGTGRFEIPDTISVLSVPVLPVLIPLFRQLITIYDFQPKLAKQAVPITGSVELEEDARNLPLVLQRILKNSEQRKRLLRLVQDFLPFLKSLNTQTLPNSALMLAVQETYLRVFEKSG